jgi:hypothetical protein
VVWSISFHQNGIIIKEEDTPMSKIVEYAKLISWGWYASYCFSHNGYVILGSTIKQNRTITITDLHKP